MTPADLRDIARLLFYAPTAQDADRRWELIAIVTAEANDKENRP